MHDTDKTVTLWVPDRDGWTGHQVTPTEAVHITTALVLRKRMERRPWWDKLADRIAFFLMDVAAWVDRKVWSKHRDEYRLAAERGPDGMAICSGWKEAYWWQRFCCEDRWSLLVHDGWRPGRYV